jgi:hypothetical protein
MAKLRALLLCLFALGMMTASKADAIILESCQADCPYYPCYSKCIDDSTQQLTTCSAVCTTCIGSTAQASPETAALNAIFSPVATTAE